MGRSHRSGSHRNYESPSGKDKDTIRFETVMQLMDEFYEKVYGPEGVTHNVEQ